MGYCSMPIVAYFIGSINKYKLIKKQNSKINGAIVIFEMEKPLDVKCQRECFIYKASIQID